MPPVNKSKNGQAKRPVTKPDRPRLAKKWLLKAFNSRTKIGVIVGSGELRNKKNGEPYIIIDLDKFVALHEQSLRMEEIQLNMFQDWTAEDDDDDDVY